MTADPATDADFLSSVFLKNRTYQLPVVRLELPYCRAPHRKRTQRVLVEWEGHAGTVEQVARAFFEKEGFTVLEGADFSAFISLFLLHKTWPGEGVSRYGDPFLNWTVLNGYKREDVEHLRLEQRARVKNYLQGDAELFTKLLEGGIDLASKYYAQKEGRKGTVVVGVSALVSVESNCMRTRPRNWNKRITQAQQPKVSLGALVGRFFQTCLSEAQTSHLLRAYYEADMHTGVPDLFVFSPEQKTWSFVEVKSASDSLRPQQHTWSEYMYDRIGGHMVVLRVLPTQAKLDQFAKSPENSYPA